MKNPVYLFILPLLPDGCSNYLILITKYFTETLNQMLLLTITRFFPVYFGLFLIQRNSNLHLYETVKPLSIHSQDYTGYYDGYYDIIGIIIADNIDNFVSLII